MDVPVSTSLRQSLAVKRSDTEQETQHGVPGMYAAAFGAPSYERHLLVQAFRQCAWFPELAPPVVMGTAQALDGGNWQCATLLGKAAAVGVWGVPLSCT